MPIAVLVRVVSRGLVLVIVLAGLQGLGTLTAARAVATEVPCSDDRTQPRCAGRDYRPTGSGQVPQVTDNSVFNNHVTEGIVSGLRKISAPGVRRDLSGQPLNTRGRLAAECLSRQSRTAVSVYVWYMCGSGPARGIEAIAQARFIAAQNADLRRGHVSPDVQWEVRTTAGPADVVLYPEQSTYPATSGAPEVIEVKQAKGVNSEAEMAEARRQATRYVDAIESDRGPAELRNFGANAYSDVFQVLQRRDGRGLPVGDSRCAANQDMLATYRARGLETLDGVLWVEEVVEQRQCLDADAGVERHKEALEEVPDSRRVTQETPLASGEEGFTGTHAELVEALAELMNSQAGEALRDHVVLLTASSAVLHLTSEQIDMIARHTEVWVRDAMRRHGAAAGAARGIAMLEAYANVATHVTAKVGGPAIAGTAGEVAARLAVIEGETAAAAAGRAAARDALAAAFGRALAREGLLRFTGLATRYVLVGVPVVGQGVLAALVAYDLYVLAREVTEVVSSGDPHLVTLDRLTYDLQTIGEFTLAQNKSETFEVQGRYVQSNGRQASVMDTLAVRTGENVVEMDVRGRLLIDGETTEMDELGSLVLDDGTILFRKGPEYGLFTDEDIALLFDTRNATLRMSDPQHQIARGLLGSHDGDPHNDITTSDQTVYTKATPAQLHGPFANSWRVTDESTLFAYAEEQSTASFTDLTFPDNIITAADFPPADAEAATEACDNAGVELGPQFEDCVFDLLVTGDTSWTEVAAGVTGDLIDPNTKQFDLNGSLVEDFEVPVGSNFAHPLYLGDPATSRVAGPFYDQSNYRFYVGDLPRHDDVTMSLRLVSYGPVDDDEETQKVDVKVDGRSIGTADLEGDSPTWTGPGSLGLADTGTTAEGRPFRIYQLTTQLDNYGDTVKVTLATHGFTGANGLAAGLDQVTMDLSVPAAQTHQVTLPVEIGPGTPAPGAGTIETRGGQDEYTFALAQTSPVYLNKHDTGNGIKTVLLDANGVRVPATSQDHDHELFDNLPAGAYTLTVRSAAGPTTYRIGLSQVPQAATATYQVGAAPVQVTTTAAGQEAWFILPATEGQQVFLQTLNSTFPTGMRWTLYRPDGTAVMSRGDSADSGLLHITTTGNWRIRIQPAGDSTGSVKLAGWAISPPDTFLGRGVLDDPARVVQIGAVGQNASLTFDGTVGQRIQMKVTDATTFGSTGLNWFLYRPDGSRPVHLRNNSLLDTFELDQTGTWRVVFDPDAELTGSFKWRAWTVPPDVDLGSSALDDPARVVQIGAVGQNASLTFDGTVGQRIQMKVTDATTFGSTGLSWYVYRPDGSRPVHLRNNSLLDTFELDQTGTWRVVFDPDAELTGSFKWRAWTVPPDVDLGSAALDDPARVVQIGAVGQNASLTFQGTAGQRIQMKVTDATTFGTTGLNWYLYRPDGTRAVHLRNNSQMNTLELNQTGTWRMVFDPAAELTGSFKWRAWTVP